MSDLANRVSKLEITVDELSTSVGLKFDHLTKIAANISDEIAKVHAELQANAREDEKQNAALSKLSRADKIGIGAVLATVQIVAEVVKAIVVK